MTFVPRPPPPLMCFPGGAHAQSQAPAGRLAGKMADEIVPEQVPDKFTYGKTLLCTLARGPGYPGLRSVILCPVVPLCSKHWKRRPLPGVITLSIGQSGRATGPWGLAGN
ncbi:hypothetical protein KIL84_008371 [Mauremys mutica]|uniref:Uncharacterized protein n=1 Tax=Mauremys mutica TaxID=74926 RepID=A0A9D4ATC5_9SAUR|nr:hypothetical protein KIL84_008371 [Mauremys mutica]